MDTEAHQKGGQHAAIAVADEALLASLGYKQEFRREFTGFEVSSGPRATGCIPLSASGRCAKSRDEKLMFLIGVWCCIQYHWPPAFHRVSLNYSGQLT